MSKSINVNSTPSIKLVPLSPALLDEFRSLMGSNEFGGCFCAVWSSFDESWEKRCADLTQPNFFISKLEVEKGKHKGFLVYQGINLVGWAGSGPKTDFPILENKLGSRLSKFSQEVWSVGCLAIRKEFRGKGLADLIVKNLIKLARQSNAVAIEAYPTYPYDEPRVFRGTFSLYQRHGFTEIGSEIDGEFEIKLMKLTL